MPFSLSGARDKLINPIIKELDLRKSRSVGIDSIQAVCLALGPYRNLTTLTASILFLHPNCQVLNHGGSRIYGDKRLDFLDGYSDEKFKAFLRYAIQISQSGTRGDHGGSIVHSHAFDDRYQMKGIFQEADGRLLKPKILALFWKESLLTANRIRELGVDVGKLLASNDKLRFLLPVRNPLDCATSNKKTGRSHQFPSKPTTHHEFLAAVLDEFVWFKGIEKSAPGRFFSFFEHDVNAAMLKRMAGFLGLPENATWMEKALQAAVIESSYKYDEATWAFYREQVGRKFADHQEFAAGLLKFCP